MILLALILTLMNTDPPPATGANPYIYIEVLDGQYRIIRSVDDVDFCPILRDIIKQKCPELIET